VCEKIRGKKPNSTQIAELAGVSRSTVSRVINGYPNVNEETRRQVQDTIKKYGYYPSLPGQMLAGKPVKCIGLFWVSIGPVSGDSLSSFFITSTIESAASLGYVVLTCIVGDLDDPREAERLRSVFYQGRIDAGIIIGARGHEPAIEQLLSDGMTVGLFDCAPDEDPALYPGRFVANFEAETGEMAMDHLISLGHRRIAVIDGDLTRYSCLCRHNGFVRSLEKHGISLPKEWFLGGSGPEYITPAGGYQAARQLFSLPGERPTALCCTNDACALGAYQAIKEAGLTVGKDISVIGMDGDISSSGAEPPLTTFDFHFGDMFRSLVTRIIRTLEGERNIPRLETSKSYFLDRESCKRL